MEKGGTDQGPNKNFLKFGLKNKFVKPRTILIFEKNISEDNILRRLGWNKCAGFYIYHYSSARQASLSRKLNSDHLLFLKKNNWNLS